MTMLRVFVDDACDLDAIRAALACAERGVPDEVGCAKADHNPSGLLEASWIRTDSPKREANVRMRAADVGRGAAMDPERLRATIAATLRAALDQRDMPDQEEQLRGWVRDLKLLSLLGALRHMEGGEPGTTDFAGAAAGTPWSHPSARRSAPRRTIAWTVSMPGAPAAPATSLGKGPDAVHTLDRAGWDAHLPDMPEIVLVREALVHRRGVARVAMGCLHGTSAPLAADAMAVMRAHARFARTA